MYRIFVLLFNKSSFKPVDFLLFSTPAIRCVFDPVCLCGNVTYFHFMSTVSVCRTRKRVRKRKQNKKKKNGKPKTRILFHYKHFAINLLKSEVNNIFSTQFIFTLSSVSAIYLCCFVYRFIFFFFLHFLYSDTLKAYCIYCGRAVGGGPHTWIESEKYLQYLVTSSKEEKNKTFLLGNCRCSSNKTKNEWKREIRLYSYD